MIRPHLDREEYWKFTGPQRLEKAVHTLHGILTGISSDGKVTEQETEQLVRWMDEHRKMQHKHPFNEIVPMLSKTLDDGKVDLDEVEDLKWLCERYDPERGTYFDQITNDMQKLQGILGGIVADGRVSDEEVEALSKWVQDNDQLRRCWPYDELEALLLEVRKDKKIDDAERQLLLTFFNEFTTINMNRAVSMPLNEVNTPITGLCAVCPEVEVTDRVFCFTGASPKMTRIGFQKLVEEQGGKFHPRVTKDVHYLVIGSEGNPCWSFACYGRKVEQAIALRKQGCQIVLVHEIDFWDAVGN